MALYLFISGNYGLGQTIDDDYCSKVTQYIQKNQLKSSYRESVKRLKIKILATIYYSMKNKSSFSFYRDKSELELWKNYLKQSEQLTPLVENNRSWRWFRFWNKKKLARLEELDDKDFYESVLKLQDKLEPDLPIKYKLDSWDKLTANTLLQQDEPDILKSPIEEVDSAEIEFYFQQSNQNITEDFNNTYKKIFDKYKEYCSEDSILSNYSCSPNLEFQSIDQQLEDISQVFNGIDISPSTAPPKPIIIDKLSLVDVQKYEYETNPDALYCKRDKSLIDTLVIHHSATPVESTVEEINDSHLSRSPHDPWYMIGYHYLVSEKTSGGSISNPSIIKGRDDELSGAHTGGRGPKNLYKKIKKGQIKCGRDNEGQFSNMDLVNNIDKHGRLSGNINSLGISIIGDYSYNEDIESIAEIELIDSSQNTKVPSFQIIDKVARLACQLQLKNENIKNIVPHSYYKNTHCPGSLKLYIKSIAKKAKKYGCSFSVKTEKTK